MKNLIHNAYESLLRKADDPEFELEDASRFERHAVNAALDLRDVMQQRDAMLEALKAARVMLRIMLECWGNTTTNDNGNFRTISGSSTLEEVEAVIAKAEAL